MGMKSFKPHRNSTDTSDDHFWYFTDKRKGFDNKSFNYGFSEMLNVLVKEFIKEDVSDFHLLISDVEIPGQTAHATMTYDGLADRYICNLEVDDPADKAMLAQFDDIQEKYFKVHADKLFVRVERTVKW